MEIKKTDTCKKCGSIEFNFAEIIAIDGNSRLKQTCKYCDTYIKWAKKDSNNKTKEEYKNEWLENQPATDKQISYIRSFGYEGDIKNKLHASQLINGYKNE